MTKKKQINSPLRYPGGKTRAIKQIVPLIPDYDEYREPFIGGGSVYFHMRQQYPDRTYWINDLNQELYMLWKHSKTDLEELVQVITQIRNTTKDGRELYETLMDPGIQRTPFERAVRFFILNRITFSGTAESGGYSKQSYEKRFTQSSIDRLSLIDEVLFNTQITNHDYETVVKQPGENVFLYLDPPYKSVESSRLYGRNGHLHTNFDHERFANVMRDCKHDWLITYDNNEVIKELFDFAYIKEWNLQYGMNNHNKNRDKEGKELFIANYPI